MLIIKRYFIIFIFVNLSFIFLYLQGCADSGDINACGGRGDLIAMPGSACGVCGTYTCDGSDAVTCEDPGSNACGGCSELDHQPGENCGECGVYECINENAVQCKEHKNDCGGCAKLDGIPGESCGECGQYKCDGIDKVICDDPGLNDCGGCTVLSHSPGESCGECGQYKCSGTEGILCDDPGLNACGGCAALPAEPNDSCGTCNENTYVCDGIDNLLCIDQHNTFASAFDLGEYTDAQNDASTIQGILYPQEDEIDWYQLKVQDTFGSSLDPWFNLVSPPNENYTMCAYFDSNSMDGCLDGSSSTYNGLSGCCGSRVSFDVAISGNGGGWIYIKIEYTGDSTGTCETYRLSYGF